MFSQRPKPGEEEEDLLAFQSKFLASGEKPSATVVRCSKKNASNCKDQVEKPAKDEIKLDHFPKPHDITDKQYRSSTSNGNHDSKVEKGEENMEVEMDKYDTHITAVLSNIIKERDVTAKPVTFPAVSKLTNPKAFQNRIVKINKRKTKTSIFAMQLNKDNSNKQASTQRMATSDETEQNTQVLKSHLESMYTSSRLITGEGLAQSVKGDPSSASQAIHRENIEKLSQMSTTDIITEQNKLKASMDPQILAFLSKRKRETQANSESTNVPAPEKSGFISGDSKIKVDKNWVNMNKVEEDKLKWMEQIPESHKNKEITLPDRFSSNGRLLSLEESESIPSYIGLHHHGDEPDLAGYTLNELVTMSRSKFLQQRVYALRLLSKIIMKDKSGEYSNSLPGPVIPLLLDSGMAFILRWALDEHADNSIDTAIDALHSLLTPSESLQSYWEEYFLSHRGCEFPSLKSESSTKVKSSKDESDFDLASRDLILGFIGMDFVARIRYILEVCRPDPSVVYKSLKILVRICQHSVEAAVKVLESPRLIDFVIKEYLNLTRIEGDHKLARVSCESMKLLRVICQAGRHAATRMLNDQPDIKCVVLKFAACVGGLHSQNAAILKTELEAWKLWTVCLSYGLMLDVFRDMLPTLMMQLQACVRSSVTNYDLLILTWAQHVIKLLTVLLTNLTATQDNQSALHWEEVKGFHSIFKTLLQQTISSLNTTQEDEYRERLLGLIAGGCDYLATYYERSYCSVSVLEKIDDDIAQSILQPLQHIVLQLSQFLNVPARSLPRDSLPCLPYTYLCQVVPPPSFVLKQRLIDSFLRLSVSVCKRHKPTSSMFLSFLTAWSKRNVDSVVEVSNPFMRISLHCFYWLVKLFVLVVVENPSMKYQSSFFHSLSLSCVSSLRLGDEHYAHDLFSNALFHSDLMSDVNIDTNVCENITDRLSSVRSTYMTYVTVNPQRLVQSRHWCLQTASEIETLLLPPTSHSMLPADWPFLPLMQIYDVSINQGEERIHFISLLPVIRSCLLYVLALEKRNYWKSIGQRVKLTRLMCLYMAGSDIFLDGQISLLMSALFKSYCSNVKPEDLDFTLPIPGIVSFYDFYTSLLDQFEAVSYGDSLFSSVILLPVTQQCDRKYKMALWADHSDAVRSIRINEDQLLVSQHFYTEPPESDYDVIRSYIRVLSTGLCQHRRSPFLYNLIIRHVGLYIANQNEESNKVMQSVSSLSGATVQDILKYVNNR